MISKRERSELADPCRVIKEIKVGRSILIWSGIFYIINFIGKLDVNNPNTQDNDKLLEQYIEENMYSSLSCQSIKLSAMSCSCIMFQYWNNKGIRRYTQDNYNLNLSYIAQNIIAMANPGKNKFSMSDNIKSQVNFANLIFRLLHYFLRNTLEESKFITFAQKIIWKLTANIRAISKLLK